MRRKNVMTVESFDTPVSRQMLHNLYQNDAFAEFNVSHCFISGVKDENELLERLSTHIKENKVSIMLIHTGHEFSRLTDFFPFVLQKLSACFKDLKIGLQRREKQSQEIIECATKGENIEVLEVNFFQSVR